MLKKFFNQIGNCLTKIEEIAYFAHQNQSKLTHCNSNILLLLIINENIPISPASRIRFE